MPCVALDSAHARPAMLTTKAEYEPDDVAAGVAIKAVERAKRCVDIARRVATATG